jgi:hypothetical protein
MTLQNLFNPMVFLSPLRIFILAVAAVANAGSAAPAMAQQIPTLSNIPAAIATAQPALSARRAALLKQRDSLREGFARNEAACSAVDEHDDAKAAFCAEDGQKLSAAVDVHIQQSRAFNEALSKMVRAPTPAPSPPRQTNQANSPCDNRLIFYDGRCQYPVMVEEKLRQRMLAAFKGIKSSTDAIDSELSELIYRRIRVRFEEIGAAAFLAITIKQPAVLAAEAVRISIDLGGALGEWNNCSATPSLQAECDNLHDFQRILHETADELSKVQKQ